MKFNSVIISFGILIPFVAAIDLSTVCNVLPPPGNGFVNDPRACSDYFSCISFLAFEISCPTGFYFNKVDLVCDIPEKAGCRICPDVGILSVPRASSCTRYTLCVNGHELHRECASGTFFNQNSGECDFAENVQCDSNTCADIIGGIGVAPSPKSCDEFFICYNGLKLDRRRCSSGLNFDSEKGRCVRENPSCFPGTSAFPISASRPETAIRH